MSSSITSTTTTSKTPSKRIRSRRYHPYKTNNKAMKKITVNTITNKSNKTINSRKHNPKQGCYAAVLNNPFSSPPCRMGWGTMVNTQLGTCTFRATASANADGTLAIVVQPTIGGASPLLFSTGNASTAAYNTVNWSNVAQYPSSLLSECRIIAAGLRVMPLTAETSAPGIVYAGALTGVSLSTLILTPPNQISNYSNLRTFVPRTQPVVVTSRPVDNSAYEFFVNNYNATNTSLVPNSSMIFVGLGFPSACTFMVEAIIHFEYVPVSTVQLGRDAQRDSQEDQDKVSKYFPSLEEAWEYTSARLNPTSFLEAATSILNYQTAYAVNGMLRTGHQPRLN